jgi:hypothetical protein
MYPFFDQCKFNHSVAKFTVLSRHLVRKLDLVEKRILWDEKDGNSAYKKERVKTTKKFM